MTDQPSLIRVVNEILDRDRMRRGLRNDTQLAEVYNVDRATIWRWRKGTGLCKAATILIPTAYAFQPLNDLPPGEPAI